MYICKTSTIYILINLCIGFFIMDLKVYTFFNVGFELQLKMFLKICHRTRSWKSLKYYIYYCNVQVTRVC